MKIERVAGIIMQMGLNPRQLFFTLRGFPVFVANLFSFYRSYKKSNEKNEWKFSLFPAFQDRYLSSGTAKGHYFHQDLWAAKKIYNSNPRMHVDIGSRIDGFVSHLLVFRSVEVIDVREIESNVRNLSFTKMDLTDPAAVSKDYCDSISCLHALEHFGLGRYGDRINIHGYKEGLLAMSKMLEQLGKLYLSVPIGKQRIEFDAHRVFNARNIENLAERYGLILKSFSYVDDQGILHEEKNIEDLPELTYGCGLFEFQKMN